MSKNTQHTPSARPAGKVVFLIFVLLVVVIGGLYFFNRGGDGAPTPPDTATTNSSTTASTEPEDVSGAEAGPKTKEAFAPLVGRWLREDGGYVIEITEVMPDGRLKAAYFNPSPIHVSRAAAVELEGSLKVGIELTDVNYPGCLYTLVFNSALDQLQGQYFQAGSGQTYDIAFVRMAAQ
jgi:hypothetical protein